MRISDWSSDVCSSDLPKYRRHGVLAIFAGQAAGGDRACCVRGVGFAADLLQANAAGDQHAVIPESDGVGDEQRSEENTSELQSLMRISYAVFCLKKKR